MIDTLDVSDSVKECMRTKVEAYTKDEIEAFAEGADKTPPDPDSQAALDKFESELAACRSSS